MHPSMCVITSSTEAPSVWQGRVVAISTLKDAGALSMGSPCRKTTNLTPYTQSDQKRILALNAQGR